MVRCTFRGMHRSPKSIPHACTPLEVPDGETVPHANQAARKNEQRFHCYHKGSNRCRSRYRRCGRGSGGAEPTITVGAHARKLLVVREWFVAARRAPARLHQMVPVAPSPNSVRPTAVAPKGDNLRQTLDRGRSCCRKSQKCPKIAELDRRAQMLIGEFDALRRRCATNERELRSQASASEVEDGSARLFSQ